MIIESSQSFPDQPWETAIWYDHAGYTATKTHWLALDLKSSGTTPTTLLDGIAPQVYRHTFTGTLPSPFQEIGKTYKGRNIKFTVRYRTSHTEPWQWVYDQFRTTDGELILQPPVDPNWVNASPVEVEPGWSTRKLNSESPDARLYYIESTQPISQPDLDVAQFDEKVLGRVTLTSRFFALVRRWRPWLSPRHGEGHFHVTEDALLCAFLRSDGRHVVLLAVNGLDESLTVFRSTHEGDIVVATRNDTGKEGKYRLLAAAAWDFESALASVMYEMRKMVGLGSTSTAPSRRPSQPREPARRLTEANHIKAESLDSDQDALLISRTDAVSLATDTPTSLSSSPAAPTPQWLESWYDSLSYCTWNSLGQDLTTDKILSGLRSLQDNNIRVSSVIIDDNWQSLDGVKGDQFHRGMTEFEANSQITGGLKTFTTNIRERFPQVYDIAVWHALLGYWGGISPVGPIAQEYHMHEVKMEPKSTARDRMLTIHPDDIHRWYNDFYAFLSQSGITSVKTDAQFMLDLLYETPDRRMYMDTYQSAWTQAHLSHFSAKAISCMSMTPQILAHSFLPSDKPRILLRNSDDFFPHVADSHTWHVFCNAHNALLVQHLNVLPDWDMFQTIHDFSGFHAAARCLSGGPIYITDPPGHHDVNLIQQMVARGVRNAESVILRPSNVGKTRSVYEGFDEGHILRIGVWDGKSEVGTGMIGLFNISNQPKTFMIPITDFPGCEVDKDPADEYDAGLDGPVIEGRALRVKEARRWVVRSHVSQNITLPLSPVLPLSPAHMILGNLPVRGYDIWSALPVHSLKLKSGESAVAVLGLLGKLTGAVAIVESRLSVVENEQRVKVAVQLKALGTLGIWTEHAKKVEDLMILIQGKAVPSSHVRVEAIESIEGDAASDVNGNQGEARRAPHIICVDVEKAWDDMGLEPGWSNEVWVDVFIP